MPNTNFTSLTLLKNNGGLEVVGPYDPLLSGDQRIVGGAMIGFLIIQGDANDDPTVIVDGSTTWDFEPPGANGKFHDWSTIVPQFELPEGLDPAKKVRAIGTAVQVKRDPAVPATPPFVEMATWCVSMDLTVEV